MRIRLEIVTLQENFNFIAFIWYSILMAVSVMAVLLPLYSWRHLVPGWCTDFQNETRVPWSVEYNESTEI